MDITTLKEDTLITRSIIGALKAGNNVILHGPGGTGKCLHPNTPVLLYNSSIIKAKEVTPGTILMGDDSGPRFVESVSEGHGELYQITTNYGDAYVVNDE